LECHELCYTVQLNRKSEVIINRPLTSVLKHNFILTPTKSLTGTMKRICTSENRSTNNDRFHIKVVLDKSSIRQTNIPTETAGYPMIINCAISKNQISGYSDPNAL